MTPTEAIRCLDDVLAKVDAHRNALRREASSVTAQWTQLGRLGAQRDDHAAALLARLRHPLAALASFAAACGEQIAALEADPFGHNRTPELAAK